jgi:hypothetical protein
VAARRIKRSPKIRELSDIASKRRKSSQFSDKPEYLGLKWSCGGAHVMFGACRLAGPNQSKSRSRGGAIWQDKKKSIQANEVLERLKECAPLSDPRLQQAPVTHVYFVRCAARKMDGDNMQASLKKIRDRVAEYLGTHDGPDGPVQWHYLQYRVQNRTRHDLAIELFTENGNAAFWRNEPAWRGRAYKASDLRERKVVDRHNQRYADNKHFRRNVAVALGRILQKHGYEEAGTWLLSHEWERDFYPRHGRGLPDDERELREAAERAGSGGEGDSGEHPGDGEGFAEGWGEPDAGD